MFTCYAKFVEYSRNGGLCRGVYHFQRKEIAKGYDERQTVTVQGKTEEELLKKATQLVESLDGLTEAEVRDIGKRFPHKPITVTFQYGEGKTNVVCAFRYEDRWEHEIAKGYGANLRTAFKAAKEAYVEGLSYSAEQ